MCSGYKDCTQNLPVSGILLNLFKTSPENKIIFLKALDGFKPSKIYIYIK